MTARSAGASTMKNRAFTAKWGRRAARRIPGTVLCRRAQRFPATRSTSGNPTLFEIRAFRSVDQTNALGLPQMPRWQRTQSVRSLNPRPLKIIGTHFSARTARVFACFAPET